MKKISNLILVLVLIIGSISVIEPFKISAAQSGFDYTNYDELEYIQSSGTQYIDIGSFSNSDTFELKFALVSVQNAYALFGNSETTTNRFFMNISSSKYRFTANGQAQSLANADTNPHVFKYNGNLSGTFDGNAYSMNNMSFNVSTFYLFGSHGSTYYLSSRLYYAKKGSNTYIPARRKSDNVLGLYNTYNSTFLTNNGSGSFTPGPIVVNTQYTVTTNVNPSGSGSVSGGGTYNQGATVTLTATANSGYTFDSWSNGSTNNPLTITLNSDINITANFIEDIQVVNYTVTTSVNPSGSGSVTGGGTYQSGSNVTLTASPNSGYVFDSWSNGSTANPYTFTLNSDTTLTANFILQSVATTYNVIVTVDPANTGIVTGGGTYNEGTTITLNATPNNGYNFDGYYLNDNLISSNPSFSLMVDNDYNIVAKFSEIVVDPTWTPWTDDDDITELVDITNTVIEDNIYLTVVKRVVYDGFDSSVVQLDPWMAGQFSLNVTGSYYDNTIVGLQGCNATEVFYQTVTNTGQNEYSYSPFIAGEIVAPMPGDSGAEMSIKFGIDANHTNNSGFTSTTEGGSSRTEACRLFGMNDGDNSITGTALMQLGYHKKTVTYNDGSLNGYTATVYVPGPEDIDLSIDHIEQLINKIYIDVLNEYTAYIHYEYDVYLNTVDGTLLPKYGSIDTNVALSVILENDDIFISDFSSSLLDKRYQLLPNSQLFKSNGKFNYHLDSNNEYDRNYCKFVWNDTSYPVWHFRDIENITSADDTIFNNYARSFLTNNYQDGIFQLGFEGAMTVIQDHLNENSSLTLGAKIPYTGSTVKFYKLRDNALLNRFNQLGSFLNGWFNRLYNSISNITGGSESNDVTNNIINDNDVNVDININNTINNLKEKDNDIDLTKPDYIIDNDHINGIGHLGQLATETYKSFSDNGLAILILLPIVIMILGLIL